MLHNQSAKYTALYYTTEDTFQEAVPICLHFQDTYDPTFLFYVFQFGLCLITPFTVLLHVLGLCSKHTFRTHP